MNLSEPKVAIIILNWNGIKYTRECLKSLKNMRYQNYVVYLVDNHSSKEEAAEIQNFENKRIHVILNQENYGFAEGNNIAIRQALQNSEIEYVIILNNDTIVTEDFLQELVRRALNHPEIGMVAPTILKLGGQEVDRLGLMVTSGGLPYNLTETCNVPLFCPSGCCALYTRPLLETVRMKDSYFDLDFFCYSEDFDLGFRAQLCGFKAAFAAKSIVYHVGSAATADHSDFALYYVHRNTLWCLIKNYPLKLFIKNFHWVILSQLLGLLKRIGRKSFGIVAKAKWDGIKGIPKMLEKRRLIQKSMRIPDSNLASLMVSPVPVFFSQIKKRLVL